MLNRHLFLFSFFSAVFITSSVLADTFSSPWFPYVPRVSGTGWVSNNQDVLQGDAMAALWGNEQNIVWGDLQGKNALDSSWSGDLGLGYRYVYNCERVLGAYLFADDSHALEGGHHFWDLSPGIESMGQLWDFRINGYFPITNKNPLVQEGFADTFNQYQFVVFSGHNQYDRLVDLYQSIGDGVDGEVGRLIIPGLTAYLGGYYFAAGSSSSGAFINPPNVKGIFTRAQYEFGPRVALEVNNTYDNVLHDTILGGVRFTLGGLGNSSQDRSDISSRLLDPIERELATQGQGTAIPVQNQLQLGSGLLLERSNIWFFEPGGVTNPRSGTAITSASQCTFEHPCNANDFDQANVTSIGNIAPGANFYLATGLYDQINTVTGDSISLTLAPNQSIFGRERGFVEPAQGSNRPLLSGSLVLQQNSADTIDSIQLFNDDDNSDPGIKLPGDDIVEVSNTLIGVDNNTNPNLIYPVGILINGNNNTLTVNNSVINAFNNTGRTGINGYVGGIFDDGTSAATIGNNNINVINSVLTATDDSSATPSSPVFALGALLRAADPSPGELGSASGTNRVSNSTLLATAISLSTVRDDVGGIVRDGSNGSDPGDASGNDWVTKGSLLEAINDGANTSELGGLVRQGHSGNASGNTLVIDSTLEAINRAPFSSAKAAFFLGGLVRAGNSGQATGNDTIVRSFLSATNTQHVDTDAAGLLREGASSGNVSIKDSRLLASNEGDAAVGEALGGLIMNSSGDILNNGTVVIDHSTVSATNTSSMGGNAYGIALLGGVSGYTINIFGGSTLSAISTLNNAYGAFADVSSTANTWQISGDTQYQISAPSGMACNQSLNGTGNCT
jgi:hypothetical protein